MNLIGKITKTQALLLLMTACFLASLLFLAVRAGSYADGTDYTISVDRGGSDAVQEEGCININTADAGLLQTLPGIGAVTAERIVRYRQENGPFSDIEELLEVPGIGESTLEGLRGKITVS